MSCFCSFTFLVTSFKKSSVTKPFSSFTTKGSLKTYRIPKREVKEVPTDLESEHEICTWLDDLETELARTFLEMNFDYDNVNAYITNIVKL